ncbi:PREDICTED: gamma-tubulin complex component 6-like [Branchiostoma belcheri]|uniref:Gamma-tubulin complex component 6 n=1 Tax=Branchiostoma belcheri TaxID=7741 RepID=A0A6P4Y818_BRABE|nr:PREDICTED: gamma-tubulin complex component 6-like [Branchiostoma belcheri]
MMSEVGITDLFNQLCKSHYKVDPRQPRIVRPKLSKQKIASRLRNTLYNTLFEDTLARRNGLASAEEGRTEKQGKLSEKERLLVFAYELRLERRFDDAARLEHLVDKLYSETDPDADVKSVLHLFLGLARSGSQPDMPPIGYRDLQLPMKNLKQSEVNGWICPCGPVFYGDSKFVDDSFHGYMQYDRSLFEHGLPASMIAMYSTGQPQPGLSWKLFEALPGQDLLGNGLFQLKGMKNDQYERQTNSTLYGALVHSHTRSIDIKLGLPELPDETDTQALGLKIYPYTEVSEDEGFTEPSDTDSSLTTPSPDMLIEEDIWEQALTYKPSQHRTWETIGCVPGPTEKPYLTEAGRQVFDALYVMLQRQVQVSGLDSCTVQTPASCMVQETDLVRDTLNVLIGVPSNTFILDQMSQSFRVRDGVHMSGTTPGAMRQTLSRFAEIGTNYRRLATFAAPPVMDSFYQGGLIFQAFTGGLRKYLQYYRYYVLSGSSSVSLLTLEMRYRKLGTQIRYLAELCMCSSSSPFKPAGKNGVPHGFPTGVKLLTYLYRESLDACNTDNYPALLSLLQHSTGPYITFVQAWVFDGICRDIYGEYTIEVNDEFLSFRDKHYWTQGFTVATATVEESVPLFLADLANDIFVCGKSLNLLRLCCPGHHLCTRDVPVPRLALTFSMEDLSNIEQRCAEYVGKMEGVARHKTVSREEMERRAVQARQDLVVLARQTASKEIDRIQSERQKALEAADAKKRQQFQELKEQMEQDLQRRASEKEKEAEEDVAFIEGLKRRESEEAEAEAELERQAREQVVEYYAKLGEEAAKREQRALWKIRRHRLDQERLNFLLKEEERLKKGASSAGEASPGGERGRRTDSPNVDGQTGSLVSFAESPEPGLETGKLVSFLAEPSAEPTTVLRSVPDGRNLLDLSIEEFLPKSEPTAEETQEDVSAAKLDEVLLEIGSELRREERTPHLLDTSIPAQTKSGTAVQQHGRPSQSSVFSEEDVTSPASGDGIKKSHPSDSVFTTDGEMGEGDEGKKASVQVGKHGHHSDSVFTPGGEMTAGETHKAQIRVGKHGHHSESVLTTWGEVKEDTQKRLVRRGEHGHHSDSAFNSRGEIREEEEKKILIRVGQHGHASDSVLGDLISGEAEQDGTKQAARSQYGHPSDLSEGPDSARPRRSKHGHASDVSQEPDAAKPRKSKHGHASDVSQEPTAARPRRSKHGHASESTAQDYLYPIGELEPDSKPKSQPQLPTPPDNAKHGVQESSRGKIPYGHSSDSTVEGILYEETIDSTWVVKRSRFKERNVHGHHSDSSVQRLLYPQEKQDSDAQKALVVSKEGGTVSANIAKKVWADQQVEPLPDKFDMLDNPPSVDLLGNLGVIPYTMFGDYGCTDSDEVDSVDIVSLPVLIKRSITSPLTAQITLVNKAIVDYFIVELKAQRHFKALRTYLLMEDGEFGHAISDQLFDKLAQGLSPQELLSPLVLNSVLTRAIQTSINRDSDYTANFSFALKWLPEHFKLNAHDTLDCLELRYKVDWPLNIVITDTTINKYNKIFSFMLQLKRITWVLKDIWFHLKRSAVTERAGNSSQFRQLQLFRHEMQHFVGVMQGYVSNQIIHVSWQEFCKELRENVHSLDELHQRHAEYLNKAIFRSLLSRKAGPVMKVITDILNVILKFRIHLVSYSWQYDETRRQAVHQAYPNMASCFHAFQKYSEFLYRVVKKLVARGYQPHLEDFLLRLSFNNYYQDV